MIIIIFLMGMIATTLAPFQKGPVFTIPKNLRDKPVKM